MNVHHIRWVKLKGRRETKSAGEISSTTSRSLSVGLPSPFSCVGNVTYRSGISDLWVSMCVLTMGSGPTEVLSTCSPSLSKDHTCYETFFYKICHTILFVPRLHHPRSSSLTFLNRTNLHIKTGLLWQKDEGSKEERRSVEKPFFQDFFHNECIMGYTTDLFVPTKGSLSRMVINLHVSVL